MNTPLNLPEHRAGATDKGGTAPSSAGGDVSRDERLDLESLGAELLRRAKESQPALEAAWDDLMAKWGIHGQPVGITRFREMIDEECASKSEGMALSRELIARREERRP